MDNRRSKGAPSVAASPPTSQILDSATSLGDLVGLPSNHLEALHEYRQGQHSLRVNRRSIDLSPGAAELMSVLGVQGG